MHQKVDVALNIFAKPYQTALSVLSLLRHSDALIDKIYLQFEPMGSRYDAVPPYAIAHYLGDRAVVFQPDVWVECDAVDKNRLLDTAYRLSMRYQFAFEHSDKKHLFIMHNDVFFKKDIIGAMLAAIGEAFAIGQIGQCWNCPAHNEELMSELGFSQACGSERYAQFKPDFSTLNHLYDEARQRGLHIRPYWEGWDEHYGRQAWPLPECRVSEWGCLVDLEQTNPLVVPQGKIAPFGAFEYCGSVTLDTAVHWFRDLNRLGLRAKHFPVEEYMIHFVGSFRMTRRLHQEAESKAQNILRNSFPDFVEWCKKQKNGLFV